MTKREISQRRSQSNSGFQPDRSCSLPSLLIRDRARHGESVPWQTGCPFDEAGKMPVLPVMRPYEEFAQAAKISIDSNTDLHGV